MAWDRLKASAALVDVLSAATGGTVTVHDKPPSSLNAPSLVVSYPTTVTMDTPTFCTDLASVAVLGVVGLEDGDSLDGLLTTATEAVDADNSLGGRVQYANPTEWRNWRIVTSAGAQLLVAELVLEIQM